MRRYRLAGGLAVIAVLVFGQNLFGRELNEAFLRLPGIDKALHFVEYLSITLCMYALSAGWVGDSRRRVLLAAGAAAVLALLDESVQSLSPGRNVEALDLAADAAGIAIAWVAVARPARGLAVAMVSGALALGGYAAWHTHARLSPFSRGLAFEREGNFVAARAEYQRALAAGLDTPGLYNQLGWVEIESGVGDPAQAVEYAGRALAVQPWNGDVLDTYGWALHKTGRHAEALDYLTRAYEKKPGMYCIHYHLGAVYLALGRRDLAVAHLTRQTEQPATREAQLARRLLDSLGVRP